MTLEPGPLVVVLVLVAAVLHATWNAIAHQAADRLVGFALLCVSTLVLGVVLVATNGPLGARDLRLAALSAAHGQLWSNSFVTTTADFTAASLPSSAEIRSALGFPLKNLPTTARSCSGAIGFSMYSSHP